MSRQLTVQELNALLERDGIFSGLLQVIAEGGQELEYCKEHKIPFSYMQDYIRKDADRLKLYEHAARVHQEWFVLRIVDELRAIGLVDILGAFNSNGTLKPIEEIPAEIRRAMAGIEVVEIFEEIDGEKVWNGYLKKVKLTDKIKSLELLGKKLNMFIDQVRVQATMDVIYKVEKFDLDDRLKALRTARPGVTIASMEPVEDAMIVTRETLEVIAPEPEIRPPARAGSDI